MIELLYALCSHHCLDHIRHEAEVIEIIDFESQIQSSAIHVTYMSNVNVNWLIMNDNLTQANTFSTEPITMLYPMYVTVDRP